MKKLHLPEPQNDSIFAYVGNLKGLILIGVAVLIVGIVLLINIKRKGDRK